MNARKLQKTRFARFEALEARQMLCEVVAPMPECALPAAMENVSFAEVAKPIVQGEIGFDHKMTVDWGHAAPLGGTSAAVLGNSTATDKAMEMSGHATSQISRGVGALPAGCAPIHDLKREPASMSFEQPADGVLEWIREKVINPVTGAAKAVGGAVARVAGHAWDLAKMGVSPYGLYGAVITRGLDYIRESCRVSGLSKIEVSDLKPGDVILFRSVGGISTGIQIVTTSRFNHSAIYAGMKEGVPYIIDATDFKGVSCRPLAEAMQGRTLVAVLRMSSLTDAQRTAVVDAARKFIGGEYSNGNAGIAGLFQHVPGWGGDSKDKMCSGLVWHSYHNALGTRITTGNMPNPGEIGRSFRLDVVGRLI